MRNTFSLGSRRGRILPVAAAVVAVALGVAACGSSSKPSTSSTTPAGSSSSSGSSTAATETAAAQTKLDALLKDPTSIAVKTPLNSKPVAGKTFVNLRCNLSANCTIVDQGAKSAAEAAGWKFKSIGVDLTNPATLLAGIQTALQLSDLGAVFEQGIPISLLGSGMAALKKRNIPMVTTSTGDTPAQYVSQVPAVAGGTPDATAIGTDLAQYFIANSGATGKVLTFGVPQIPSLATIPQAFNAAVKADCTVCVQKEVDVTSAQVNAGVSASVIVTTLQRNKDLTWVMSTNCGFTESLPAALNAAGLTGIKYICAYPDQTTDQQILDGKTLASNLQSYAQLAWEAFDGALRFSEGMTITPDVGRSPEQILTKANLGTPVPDLQRPTDWQSEFKTLWKVG